MKKMCQRYRSCCAVIIVWLVVNMNLCVWADSCSSENKNAPQGIRELFSVVEELERSMYEEIFPKIQDLQKKHGPILEGSQLKDGTTKIEEKYVPQILENLDKIMAVPDCPYEDFSKAIDLRVEYLLWIDEATCPKLRDYINSFDALKYPQIAHKLRINFLEVRFCRAKFACIPGFYAETIEDIRKEVRKYGKELPPDVADLARSVLLTEKVSKSPNYEAFYDEFKKAILEASSEETRKVFQEYEEYLEEFSK